MSLPRQNSLVECLVVINRHEAATFMLIRFLRYLQNKVVFTSRVFYKFLFIFRLIVNNFVGQIGWQRLSNNLFNLFEH